MVITERDLREIRGWARKRYPIHHEDLVGEAIVSVLEKGHDLTPRNVVAFTKMQAKKVAKQINRLNQGGLTKAEEEWSWHRLTDGEPPLFVSVDRCRRRRTATGYGRGYHRLPTVPCAVCATPFPHRIARSGRGKRQETCSKSCAAKLRWQRKRGEEG